MYNLFVAEPPIDTGQSRLHELHAVWYGRIKQLADPLANTAFTDDAINRQLREAYKAAADQIAKIEPNPFENRGKPGELLTGPGPARAKLDRDLDFQALLSIVNSSPDPIESIATIASRATQLGGRISDVARDNPQLLAIALERAAFVVMTRDQKQAWNYLTKMKLMPNVTDDAKNRLAGLQKRYDQSSARYDQFQQFLSLDEAIKAM